MFEMPVASFFFLRLKWPNYFYNAMKDDITSDSITIPSVSMTNSTDHENKHARTL